MQFLLRPKEEAIFKDSVPVAEEIRNFVKIVESGQPKAEVSKEESKKEEDSKEKIFVRPRFVKVRFSNQRKLGMKRSTFRRS